MSRKLKKVKVRIKARDADKEYDCKICGKTNTGYSNNGNPVVDGPVCNSCNAKHVIPARLEGTKSQDEVARLNDMEKYEIIDMIESDGSEAALALLQDMIENKTGESSKEVQNAIDNIDDEDQGHDLFNEVLTNYGLSELYNKSLDGTDTDEMKKLKAELAKMDAEIKAGIAKDRKYDNKELANKRNDVARKIAKLNNKASDETNDFLEDITEEVAELLPDVEYNDIKDEVMSMYNGETDEEIAAMFEGEENYAAQIDGLVSRFDNKAEDSADIQTTIEVDESLAQRLLENIEQVEDSRVEASIEGSDFKISIMVDVDDDIIEEINKLKQHVYDEIVGEDAIIQIWL